MEESNKTNIVCCHQLVEELVGKWRSFPETQHTPLCAHLLGLAMKAVTQLALGERFMDDAEVLCFRKNHGAVRQLALHENTLCFCHKASVSRI